MSMVVRLVCVVSSGSGVGKLPLLEEGWGRETCWDVWFGFG